MRHGLLRALILATVLPSYARKQRELLGRFLHITDIHPDPFYRSNASVAASCHHSKPYDDPDRAGPLGTAVSDCDTPIALVDHAFDWLERDWAREVDFVIWTGDNARHDIDSSLPRSLSEIYQLNRDLAKRFREMFEDRGIPVVPSLGNNDIYPHNIIVSDLSRVAELELTIAQDVGPNKITTEYAKIWSDFIPGEEYHTVTRGIYFSREVIPEELAVISLNTMYFFDNNKVVDGCPVTRSGEAADPGTLQLDWLIVQLDRFRQRGVQVWLSGHVPPTQANWYPDCLTRFSEMVLRFQDTIVGQMYGHVNVDTFNYLDYNTILKKSNSKQRRKDVTANKFVHDDIHAKYEALPSFRKMKLEDYAIVHTGPSVIPTYLPTVRIWNYNISDPSSRFFAQDSPAVPNSPSSMWQRTSSALEELWFQAQDQYETLRRRKKRKGKKRKKKKPIPRLPRYFSPDSPSRTNRYLSPLGYTQYYLPIQEHTNPNWTIEYITYPHNTIRHFLPKHMHDNATTPPSYDLKDLTIPSWLGLAKKMTVDKKLWKGYVRRMYCSSGAEDAR